MLPNRTLGAIPQWMSDPECCTACQLVSVPEVSIEALRDLATVLAELPHATIPNTISASEEAWNDAKERRGCGPVRVRAGKKCAVERASPSLSGAGGGTSRPTFAGGGAGGATRRGGER
ncbi:MAG TPA: hypothetical protein VK670_17470 [Silvibacterium sp.]|nr:hypothetical protein [Silvibacterium sp.]